MPLPVAPRLRVRGAASHARILWRQANPVEGGTGAPWLVLPSGMGCIAS